MRIESKDAKVLFEHIWATIVNCSVKWFEWAELILQNLRVKMKKDWNTRWLVDPAWYTDFDWIIIEPLMKFNHLSKYRL